MAIVESWVLVLFLVVLVVRGDYNCSTAQVSQSQMEDFKATLKKVTGTLNTELYSLWIKNMNISSTSEKTNHTVYMWGNCELWSTSDACRDCVNELTGNLHTICNNSSWGELAMVVKGKNVCFVHYNAVDFVVVEDAAPATLIQKFRNSLLFFLLWHLLMFMYMCLT